MSLSFDKKIEALIAEITAAFDGVSREDGMTFHEAARWDGKCQPGAWIDIERAKDTETRWQDVPDEWIGDNSTGAYTLNYLDAKGFRYYIPAFMIWALKAEMGLIDISQSNTDVVLNLVPHASHNRSSIQKFSKLSECQAKAVAHFLEFIAAQSEFEGGLDQDILFDSDAKQALKAYWNQFL
jgi:hypothetical protein